MSKVIFLNGTFDVLHVGHFSLVDHCKKLAGKDGRLYLAIDSDEKIEKDKGGTRPVFTESERRKALEVLCAGVPFEIHVFNTNKELYDMIKFLNPDCIVKGGDWEGNVVGSDVARVEIFPRMEEFSSTKIINRIIQKNLSLPFVEAIKK